MSRVPLSEVAETSENPEINQQNQFIEHLIKNYETVNEQYNILNEMVKPPEYSDRLFEGILYDKDSSYDQDYYRYILAESEKKKLQDEMRVMSVEMELRKSKIKSLNMIDDYSKLIEDAINEFPPEGSRSKSQKEYMKSIRNNKNLWEIKLKSVNMAIGDLRNQNPEIYNMGKSLFASPCMECQYKTISILTGFPEIVLTEQEIDGAGLFNSETPTDQDKRNRIFWLSGGGLAKLSFLYSDAGRHMAHFIEASGEPLKVSVEGLEDDIPEFTKSIDKKLSASVDKLLSGFTGEKKEIPFETDWDQFPDDDSLTYGDLRKNYTNWFYAMGIFSYKIKGVATISPPDKAGGKPKVEVKYQVFVYDRYNWDQGKAVAILWIKVEDIEFVRLHRTGLAQEYFIYGIGEEKSKKL